MDKQGLINCLESLEIKGLNTKMLTTDRHSQIKSYMKNHKGNINHQVDIWHASRNIKKKPVKVVKNREDVMT